MRNRYKRLDLPYFMDSSLSLGSITILEDSVKSLKLEEIEPVFFKDGHYLDRLAKFTWFEIDNKAYIYPLDKLPGEYKQFIYDLKVSEGNNLLDNNIMRALETLILVRLATPKQKELFYSQKERLSIRETSRNTRKHLLFFQRQLKKQFQNEKSQRRGR